MSAKNAQSLGAVVATNVTRWRTKRGLDQQGLASRLEELGWPVDRTAVNRIENCNRKVTVDELAMLALALSVPLALLLVPIFDEGDVDSHVAVAPTRSVPRWDVLEWLIGNAPIAVLVRDMPVGELSSGVEPLALYDQVCRARGQIFWIEEESSDKYREALQQLVDAVSNMETAGWPSGDLISDRERKAIKRLRIQPRPKPRRMSFGPAWPEGYTP